MSNLVEWGGDGYHQSIEKTVRIVAFFHRTVVLKNDRLLTFLAV